MDLVVLAAGRGTRMDPLTRTRPKVLLPVAGRPLMEHTLAEAAAAGFKRVHFIVHHGAKQIVDRYAEGALGMEVHFIEQGTPKGTGHALAALSGHVEDAVVVSGDAFVDRDDLQAIRATDAAVGVHEVEDVSAYGAVRTEGDRFAGVQEKAASGPGLVNAGTYRITKEWLAACAGLRPSARGELELTDALNALVADGHAPRTVELPSWQEAGRPWDLLDLQASLLARIEGRIDGDVGERVDLEGPVVVEKGARVLNGCRIEGPVHIGAGARVGPNSYLRPATMIGACHIGAGVEVKNSIVADGSNVPHLSYVGDSVIGSGCNLGAGTQVANLKVNDRDVRVHWQAKEWLDTGRRKFGVVLGDGAKTGVNASLNPGTVLAPGVLVGAGQAVSGWLE